MADQKKKLPLEVSVRGVAAYAWLDKKDTQFAKTDDEGKYKLSIIVEKEELDELTARLDGGKTEISGKEWIAHLQDLHEKAGGDEEPQNCPVKDGDKQLDKKGKKKKQPDEARFGKYQIDFKSGYRPQQVDTKKNDLPPDVRIFSGDVVKVVYRPFQYEGGVSLRLNAVMLIEKRSGGGAANAFGEEEGYVVGKAGRDAFGEDGDKAEADSDGDY